MSTPEVLLALQTLIAEYWASVDRVAGADPSAASFYVESGEMLLGSLHVQGRENIEAFFVARNEKEIANRRSTRHFTANLRLRDVSETRATVHALVIAYAGIGEFPLPSEAPSAVGDFTFSCARDPARGWRLEKVVGTTVFVGASASSFAKGAR